MTLLASDRVALLATIDPDALTATAFSSDWVDIQDYNSLMAVVYLGTLGVNATVNAKLEQDDVGDASNTKDITGKAITELTQAGTDASDNQAIINVREDELDVAGGFRYVRLTITIGVATSDGGGAIYGINPTYGVASDNDLASVAEIVN